MKRNSFFAITIFFLMIINLTGCKLTAKHGVENDITLDSTIIDKVYHLMEKQENPNCNLHIKFIFPVSAKNKDILTLLQKEFVSAYFGDVYDSLPPIRAAQKYANDYLEAYKELETDFKEELLENRDEAQSWFSYYEESSNDIVYNKDKIISFTVNFENYTGGAHGSHSCNHYVIDLNNGKRLHEEDIFIDNYQEKLTEILIRQLTSQNNLSDPNDLENIGIFSIEDIAPNDNYYVDETGITYTYNVYEIAPYAAGAINIHLSFDQLELLLKQGTPIAKIAEL